MLATKDALDIPPDVRRYVGEFLRPSFLNKQDEGQGGKSRNKEFEYICNALVRAGGTLTWEELFEVEVSFYFEESRVQPSEKGLLSYSVFRFLYLEREIIDIRLKRHREREDILDAGIVVRKDDGNYTFHDDILSLIGHLL